MLLTAARANITKLIPQLMESIQRDWFRLCPGVISTPADCAPNLPRALPTWHDTVPCSQSPDFSSVWPASIYTPCHGLFIYTYTYILCEAMISAPLHLLLPDHYNCDYFWFLNFCLLPGFRLLPCLLCFVCLDCVFCLACFCTFACHSVKTLNHKFICVCPLFCMTPGRG